MNPVVESLSNRVKLRRNQDSVEGAAGLLTASLRVFLPVMGAGAGTSLSAARSHFLPVDPPRQPAKFKLYLIRICASHETANANDD